MRFLCDRRARHLVSSTSKQLLEIHEGLGRWLGGCTVQQQSTAVPALSRAAPAPYNVGHTLDDTSDLMNTQREHTHLHASSSTPRLDALRIRLASERPSLPPHPDTNNTASNPHWRDLLQLAQQQQAASTSNQMLTDTFDRVHTYLRISLTERCNLRCLYCMPEEGVELTPAPHLLTADEIERLARLFAAAGVDKIRLTGGEPTLRADLVDIVRRLRGIPGIEAVAMTSNGLTLAKKLPALQDAGLTHLNLSLDTLQPARFEAMTRRRGHARVMQALQEALRLGYDPVKVNVVVMRGQNDDELVDFVRLTRDDAVNVRFIEYMPFDGNVWSDTKMVGYRDMQRAIEAAFPEGLERCDDPKGEVAKNYRIPGFRGTVSFVTSMTHSFCGECNRLRIMADGNLKVCLFGANEVGLLPALREGCSDEDLGTLIGAAVKRKRAAHAGMFELARNKNRAMVKIGG